MRYFLYILQLSALLIIAYSNVIPEDVQVMDHSHPHGRPLNIMNFDNNETIVIDTEALNEVFLHPEIKDRKIVAISIIGAFRKGKSFLMDYALRYMYANYKSISLPDNPLSNKRDWIGDVDAPLKGFTWRGGASRDTAGVVIWSDVFLHEQLNPKTKTIEKLAIVLMDTQGLFDSTTSPTDNSRIFALGTLISSIQIFNLNDVIQENQLEYLQMATDFAKFAMKKNKQVNKNARDYKPFQTLVFLMRDWQNNEEFEYGSAGGSNYLQQVLNIKATQPKPLQQVREYISNSFEQRLCFLLPHPGFQAVNNKQYDGRFSELDEEFQIHLKDFLNWLLAPKNLKKKKILNDEVVGSQYLEFVKAYLEAFQSNEIPRIDTLHGITVKKQYDIVIAEALAEYKNSLEYIEFKVNDTWKELLSLEQEMNVMHTNGLEKAMKIFKDKKKLGSDADEKKFEGDLRNQIEVNFNEWKSKLMDSYQKLKEVEDQKNQEIEELNRRKEEELKLEQERSAEQKRLLAEELEKKTTEFEAKLASEKNLTAQEVEAVKLEFEKVKEQAEKHRQEMWSQMEAEKRQIEEKAKQTEINFKKQMQTMQDEVRKKEEMAKKQIEDKQSERLEMLRIQAEDRRIQYEKEMKISERREQAQAEQRRFEREQMAEEKRIREETRRDERQAREKAEREQREADMRFQQQLLEAKRQADREEREARERNDLKWQQMMAAMNKPPPPPPPQTGGGGGGGGGGGFINTLIGGVIGGGLFSLLG